jgi:general secretion pathway protein C
MGGNSQGRSGFAQSALVPLATFAALTILVLVLAYWTWVWLAPRPVARARAIEGPTRIESAYTLFGGVARNPTAPAPTALAIRLLGVAAASAGNSSYAIVQLDANRILAAREGTDVAPGVRLAQVQPGQIILERNGVRETLALPEKTSRAHEATAAPPPTATPEPPARRPRD